MTRPGSLRRLIRALRTTRWCTCKKWPALDGETLCAFCLVQERKKTREAADAPKRS